MDFVQGVFFVCCLKSGCLHGFDSGFDAFRVRGFFQIWKQLTQTSVVQFDGRGPEIMHLDYLTHEWIEKTHDTQHEFSGRADAGLMMNGAEDELGEFPGGDETGAGHVPRLAIRFFFV